MESGQAVEDTRSVARATLHTFLLSVLVFLSFTGNCLVCLAMYRNRRLRTVTNLYVLGLALADLTVAIFVFLFSLIASAVQYWPFGYNFCQFHGFMSYYWGAVSIFTLAITSVNRYICIAKPQRYLVLFTRKRTVISIVFTWIILLFLGLAVTRSIPVVFLWQPNDLYCREKLPDNVYKKVLFSSLVLFFISLPMIFVVIGYINVFCAVRRHNAAVAPSLHGGPTVDASRRTEEIRTARILFAAVLGVSACWTPFIIMMTLDYTINVRLPSTFGYLRVLFAALSAFTNPIIYGVMNRAMRKEFLKIMCCTKHR